MNVERGRGTRWWALGAISLGLLAVGLDGTVLSLALPTLAGALRASESQLQWFVTSYTLAVTASMLPAGLLGDRYGRKRVLLGALLVFGFASVGCALATGPATFVVARAALGAAGAGMIVMALAVITVLFDADERPRAIGVWAAANFLALPLGPLLGGWTLAHLWWGWVFLLNIPVVLLGLAAVVVLVPESRERHRPEIDWVGVLTSSLGLTAVMYGVIEAGRGKWSDPSSYGPILFGLVLLAVLAWWECRLTVQGRTPLVDMSLFRIRSFTAGAVLAAVGVFGLFGLLFLLPQYWQAVVGVDTQGAGLRLLPLIGGMAVGAMLADRAAVLLGARTTTAAGLGLLAVAMLGAATTTTGSPEWQLAVFTAAAGAGAGLGLATAAAAAIVELDEAHSGVGTALVQAVTKLGPAIGAAALGTVLATSYQALVPTADLPAAAGQAVRSSVFAGLAVARQTGSATLTSEVQSAFVSGMDAAMRWAAVAVAVGVPLAWAFLPRRAAQAAESSHEQTPVAH